ncbi:single-stranded DNA-binding protein [Vagococcus lutrae]|uniref:single-stranded DNA-binding protein n=1 Tax=Vagococcus lutrae TaxID=81947 RepID=UPI00288E289B|nr:single-stranded DNA-binding protein [Vagococcus lutrae]MDT2808355.1 single-stranded DNA-binding protein [Vagococcus lutrae]
MAINNIVLQGNITKDLELRTAGTKSVLNFTVASQRNFVNKKTGQRESDFINCVAFEKTAESIAQYLSKGSEIIVTGRMQSGSYEKQDGQRVYTTDLFVDSFSFTRGSNKQEGQTQQSNQHGQTQQTGFFGAGTTQSNDFGNNSKIEIDEDDLPF